MLKLSESYSLNNFGKSSPAPRVHAHLVAPLAKKKTLLFQIQIANQSQASPQNPLRVFSEECVRSVADARVEK